MTTRPLIRLVASTCVALLALGVVAVGAADAAPADRFFLRNDAGVCSGRPFLSRLIATGEPACGYVQGAPLGEVYHTTGDPSGPKDYPAEDGLPVTVDTDRDATGQIVIGPRTNPDGQRRGVGQIVVELTLTGTKAGETVALGATKVETIAVPTDGSKTLPFTIDLQPSLGDVTLDGLNLRVNVRGVHALHGFTRLNGESFLDLPVVPPVVAAPTEG